MKVPADREAHARLAYSHIHTNLPELRDLLDVVGVQQMPQSLDVDLAEALGKIVIGQMLSGSVADVIYKRVQKKLCDQGGRYVWDLLPDDLIACGLSRRKIKTFQEFGNSFQAAPEIIMAWHHMGFEELRKSVCEYWGLGEWSAAMLAIFHLGIIDVFPASDGSLFRAIEILQRRGAIIKPELASPYRSYLCLYLWAGLDRGYI